MFTNASAPAEIDSDTWGNPSSATISKYNGNGVPPNEPAKIVRITRIAVGA